MGKAGFNLSATNCECWTVQSLCYRLRWAIAAVLFRLKRSSPKELGMSGERCISVLPPFCCTAGTKPRCVCYLAGWNIKDGACECVEKIAVASQQYSIEMSEEVAISFPV